MDISQIEDIVYDINEQMIKQEHYDYGVFFGLELKCNGYNTLVSYLDVPIWFSDEDEREWIEEKNDYEPLDGFLKKKVNEINSLITNIEL